MFTGIIEGMGTITKILPAGEGRKMLIEADFLLDDTRIGDSIAVNGACLTAVSIEGRSFSVDIAPETVKRSRFKIARAGERVNLERALRLSSRLDGHLVTGHIDGEGQVLSIKRASNAIIIEIGVPDFMGPYLVPKGSIAVDGTSLTINTCSDNSFSVSIIPHTAGLSTVGSRLAGESVNIETDIVGKYIERLLKAGLGLGERASSLFDGEKKGIDLAFLAKNGFL